jgi:hypothetical protein
LSRGRLEDAALAAHAPRAPDAQAERTARGLDSLAQWLAALPDHGPHAGGAYDPYAGPQSFEETNECLEELAIWLGESKEEVAEQGAGGNEARKDGVWHAPG